MLPSWRHTERMSSRHLSRILNDAENKAVRESLRERVYKKTPGLCWYCGIGIHAGNRTMDHVIPRASNGDDTEENLVPCCRDCNRLKGNLTIEQFRKRIRWKLAGVPEFNHEQAKFLYDTFGILVEPECAPFWFER